MTATSRLPETNPEYDGPHGPSTTSWREIGLILLTMAVIIVIASFWLVSL